ncbi:MAG: hypothetical protein AAF871_13150 [Pseudomonadota bacterium]
MIPTQSQRLLNPNKLGLAFTGGVNLWCGLVASKVLFDLARRLSGIAYAVDDAKKCLGIHVVTLNHVTAVDFGLQCSGWNNFGLSIKNV